MKTYRHSMILTAIKYFLKETNLNIEAYTVHATQDGAAVVVEDIELGHTYRLSMDLIQSEKKIENLSEQKPLMFSDFFKSGGSNNVY